MKKLLLTFAFIGIISVILPNVANACSTVRIPCGDWSADNDWTETVFIAYVCDLEDWDTWRDLKC